MKEVLDKANLVRIKFKKKIYKKHPFYIPLYKERDGVFVTGQDLSYAKMVGKEPLTSEEKKKYPFVVDPTEHYRIFDGQSFDMSKYVDKTFVELALASKEIAPTLSEYEDNKSRYVGYLDSPIAESQVYNKKLDSRYEAETLIRNSPIDDFARIALIVNYTMSRGINTSMPMEYVKAELLKAANDDPQAVLLCFPKHNPGIEMDLYILDLVHHKILSKKPTGEIFDGDVFVGANLSGAKNWMTQRGNAGYVDKWKQLLDKAKGFVSEKAIDKLSNLDQRSLDYKELIDTIKIAIVDGKADKVEYHLDKLVKEYGDILDSATEDLFYSKLNELKSKLKADKDSAKQSQFKSGLEELSLDELHKKIRHGNTPYDIKACKSFIDDKDALVTYMVQVKFPV